MPASPHSFTLPLKDFPYPSPGILTGFPFDGAHTNNKIEGFETEFPHLLGSTNPYPTAVVMEPFPTSVFKESHLNICYYHQDLH